MGHLAFVVGQLPCKLGEISLRIAFETWRSTVVFPWEFSYTETTVVNYRSWYRQLLRNFFWQHHYLADIVQCQANLSAPLAKDSMVFLGCTTIGNRLLSLLRIMRFLSVGGFFMQSTPRIGFVMVL